MLVPPSFLFALDLSCGVTSCHSCDVMWATAQLCSPKISPKVVRDFRNPSFVNDPLSATAQLCSPSISPKVVAIF